MIPLLDQPATMPSDDLLAIETRFGRMAVSRSSVIGFPNGLLGFGEARDFVLVALDNPKYKMFRVLQCIRDSQLSFIVFPPSPESGLIDPADIEMATQAVGFTPIDTVVLLLVTVRKTESGHALSVNLRAPLLIDAGRMKGVQYVLQNERYPVRFTL
jgi:flagellar assembly factor FliW